MAYQRHSDHGDYDGGSAAEHLSVSPLSRSPAPSHDEYVAATSTAYERVPVDMDVDEHGQAANQFMSDSARYPPTYTALHSPPEEYPPHGHGPGDASWTSDAPFQAAGVSTRASAARHHDFLEREGPTKTWSALWIRPAILWAFAAIFMVFVVGLILLWHYSVTRGGYSVAERTSHYSWTYGPTAVIVIAAGLWRQVDIYCKTSAPWADLMRRDKPLADVLREDYISPMPHIILYRAFKDGQWAVLMSSTGQIIFKVLVS